MGPSRVEQSEEWGLAPVRLATAVVSRILYFLKIVKNQYFGTKTGPSDAEKPQESDSGAQKLQI